MQTTNIIKPDYLTSFLEYSSALQKDILVHGRLYATLNYLCFHAKIFTYETSVRQIRVLTTI